MFTEIRGIENNLYGGAFSHGDFIMSLQHVVDAYSMQKIK